MINYHPRKQSPVASLRAQSLGHCCSYDINDLNECLRSPTPCMYADDTQNFSSPHAANELVIKLNSDLAHVCNWLIEDKL